MDIAALIQTLAIAALPVIFAITLHEAAHGYAARHFGDPTAWQAGRISLNPLRHVDLVGTLLVPGLILVTSYLAAGTAMLFGWAKPVPVNFGRLRHPKRDMLWVAAAGPAVNLLMALAWAGVFKLISLMPFSTYSLPLAEMSRMGINVNLVLMVLNLLPLPPLMLSSQGGLAEGDVKAGLDITGHFLEQFVFGPLNRPLPAPRMWLIDRLTEAGRL